MNRPVEMASAVGSATLLGVGLLPFLHREAPPTVWFDVQWPRELDADAVIALLRHLSATRRPNVVAFEVRANRGRVSYRVGVAAEDQKRLLHSMQTLLPGVLLEPLDASTARPLFLSAAVEVRLGTRERALRTDSREEVARSSTTALAQAHSGTTVVQWLLGPRLQPHHVGSESQGLPPTTTMVRRALLGHDGALDARARTELRNKVGMHGFRARLCVGTTITDAHLATGVLRRIVGALKVSEAPGAHLRVRAIKPSLVAMAVPPRTWGMAINIGELAGMLAWPVGDGDYSGVTRMSSRRHPVPATVPKNGRVIGDGNHPQSRRPVALSPRDGLMHTHVVGPTGSGKSWLLANLVLQDIEAGRGAVVVEPKGDLVADILARIPKHREVDVVVLDPSDLVAPVGLNPLVGGAAELVSDQLLAAFRGLYGDYLGPRTVDVLHAALLTLARSDHATLVALPLLLTDTKLRAELTAPLRDDLALGPFWEWYENLSEAERGQVTAPAMNKVRPLLRSNIRCTLGQLNPRFDISQVFTERKILLVPLNKGVLGSEAAGLIGSLVVSRLWSAAQSRASIDPKRRYPVSVVIDEFQDFMHLPTDLGDVLAQARGLGIGITLAHQHLQQLTPDVRAAVLANARSRICFRLSAEDAAIVARTTQLFDALDFQSLGRYEVYASLVAHGEAQAFCSATTRALPNATSSAKSIRAMSREAFGRDRDEVEAELRTLVVTSKSKAKTSGVGKKTRGAS